MSLNVCIINICENISFLFLIQNRRKYMFLNASSKTNCVEFFRLSLHFSPGVKMYCVLLLNLIFIFTQTEKPF